MLEKIFTSKARVKLLTHFLFSNEKLTMREISRKLKLPVSAVSRELKNLEKVSLIKKEKDRFAANSGSNILPELKSIFLKTDAFKSELEEAFSKEPVKFALVFGSFATDKYSEESDIDLFVIGDVSSEKIFSTIKPIEGKLQREINPVIWKLNELKKKKKGSFVRNIFKNKIVMIKGDERELRKIVG